MASSLSEYKERACTALEQRIKAKQTDLHVARGIYYMHRTAANRKRYEGCQAALDTLYRQLEVLRKDGKDTLQSTGK